jgi:hypothetical protein
MARSSTTIELSNEFTSVRVEQVDTGNGSRLRISSPRLGCTIDLDPLQLEAIAWQQPEFFSSLLATPLGPDVETRVGNLSELITGGGEGAANR